LTELALSFDSSILAEFPELDSYSAQELEQASAAWPAIDRYRSLLLVAPNQASDELRLCRHQLWLRAALATYFDRRSAREICFFWSKAAESLILQAWRVTGLSKTQVCLLALGKLGSEELNLSSDVDLLMVRADSEPPDLKALRLFQGLLSELTSFGFALRVDFTLRPGGTAASAIPSLSEFENYYGYQGEMWERLAFVRMRILQSPLQPEAAGANEPGMAPLKEAIAVFSRKFSYRKHLDYTLLDELKTLRNKIRSEKFQSRPDIFHLKLGAGGIRELELFVHALQVIHGGRNATLQTFSTSLALEQIRALKLLPENECDFLLETYWYLRMLENRLQAFEDQQSYLVDLVNGHPALPHGFQSLLRARCERVSAIATSLFGDAANLSEVPESLPEELTEQQSWFLAKGFSESSSLETWPELIAATALSRKSDRDEKARQSFLKNFVTRLATTKIDRDLGLSLLLDFVKATRAKASFFTLLNREPKLVENLVQLFATSPYLGSILASRPELIDEFIYRKQAEPSEDMQLMLESLAERRLLAELISANHFLTDRNLRNLTLNLTDNADAICRTLLNRLIVENGPSEISLIAMGKWGGREIGLRSDLDFMFVTPDEPNVRDHKIAKRFLSRITESHRGGAIYSVDLRLRPSGNAGPILISSQALHDYLGSRAAVWERQAYLRARPLSELSFSPAQVSAAGRLNSTDLQELAMIRSKLFITPQAGELDLKLSCGGLADIEFTAQIACLAQGEFSLDPSTSAMVQYLESFDAKWKTAGPSIRKIYGFLREVEQLFQLTTSQSGSKMRVRSDEFRRLALILDSSPQDLDARIRSTLVQAMDALEPVRTIS
jgi:glutamate-ammonia-ligase adenylyltransferase